MKALPGEWGRVILQRARLTGSVGGAGRGSMRYVEFRDTIREALRRNPAGLTWMELKRRFNLPYDRPCPSWVKRLEDEVWL